MHLRSALSGSVLQLSVEDDWTASTLPLIAPQLDALEFAGLDGLEIDAARAATIDLSGAWLLHDLSRRAAATGLAVVWTGGAPPPTVALVDGTLGTGKGSAFSVPAAAEFRPVTAIGRTVVERWAGLQDGLAFTGEAAVRMLRGVPRVKSITIAVLREMGVLLTAIIVAGRSGSAFAAEIGAMKLNEETDALRAIGISTMEVLVLPRVIGLVIALPLLTVVADAVGILGGALLCYSLLDMPFVQYFQRVHETVGAWTFWVGIIKAPVFALLIAGAGAYRGMQVRGSSRELGRLTTLAVVQAIFLVILANAMFAVLFMEMGI